MDEKSWYRYEFTNAFGRTFEVTGVAESYDRENRTLRIDKGDGTESVEDFVDGFKKTEI